jgi:hypothetical protein
MNTSDELPDHDNGEEGDFFLRGQTEQDLQDYAAGHIERGSERWLSLYAAGLIEPDAVEQLHQQRMADAVAGWFRKVADAKDS